MQQGRKAYQRARHTAEDAARRASEGAGQRRFEHTPERVAADTIRKKLLEQLNNPRNFAWIQSTLKEEDTAATLTDGPSFNPGHYVYASWVTLDDEAFKVAARLGNDEQAVVGHIKELMRELVGNAPLAVTYIPGAKDVFVATDAYGLEELQKNTQPQRGVRA